MVRSESTMSNYYDDLFEFLQNEPQELSQFSFSPEWKEAAKEGSPHPHCDYCIRSRCPVRDNDCPADLCPGGCGAWLHRCKLRDHLALVCPEERVPCLNACNGCRDLIRRKMLGAHIQHCPASLILCRFSYERRAIERLPEIPADGHSADERLLDEKILEGDLSLMASQDGAVQHSDDQLALDCRPGDYGAVMARFHTYSPWPQKKVSLATSVSRKLDYLQKEAITHSVTFACNAVVRRDEFADHWKSLHLDVHEGIASIVTRCPLYMYGCQYGQQSLAPLPSGASFDYSLSSDLFLLQHPVPIDPSHSPLMGQYMAKLQTQQELALYGYCDEEEGSLDYLGQLPVEVLEAICLWLDSQSLWCLSLTNHYLRKVCFNLVYKRGVVCSYWSFDSSKQRWFSGPWRWTYSKVFSGIPGWRYTDAPSIGSHLQHCQCFKANTPLYSEDTPWPLPG